MVSVILAALFPSIPHASAADELELIRAAVEERLSSIRSLEVRYRIHWERPSDDAPTDLERGGDPDIEWVWADGRQFYNLTFPDTPGGMAGPKWAYDGRRTVEFYFDPDDRERVSRVLIQPGPPRADLADSVAYRTVLGMRGLWTELDLAAVCRLPSARITEPTTIDGRACPTIEVHPTARSGHEYMLRVAFDPSRRYLPLRFERLMLREPEEPGGEELPPSRGTLYVDETIAARDAATGVEIELPKTWRSESFTGDELFGAGSGEVYELHVNRDIPQSRFQPEVPFGTEIFERTAPGRPLERRVTGGAPAMEALREENTRRVAEELDGLKAELAEDGVRYDGSPPAGHVLQHWFIACGFALLLIGTIGIVRRRSAN